MTRTPNCEAKLDLMNKALRYKEPDRVPVSDWLWASFVIRWRAIGSMQDPRLWSSRVRSEKH